MPSSASFNMRAIMFLYLLGLVASNDHENYNWNVNPDIEIDNESSEGPEQVCLVDQTSCGCCLMQKQMYKMEMFFNMTLSELQKGLQETQNALNNVRASRSAFSVALTNGSGCLGPHRDDTIVDYKHVFINLGDGYNPSTGKFTVPRSGIYSLALTVYSDAGGPGNSLSACASLTVNGRPVAWPSENNNQDQEDSATAVVALPLDAGDEVYVHLPIGCFLCDSESHFNTFTGFLLYATD